MLSCGRRRHEGTNNLKWLSRLGNKTFSYKLPIHPHRAQNDPSKLGLPGAEHDIAVSRSEFKLCQKVLANLLPQLTRLQRDALAHHNYVESTDVDQLAIFMRPDDVLLAASDQVQNSCGHDLSSQLPTPVCAPCRACWSLSRLCMAPDKVSSALACQMQRCSWKSWGLFRNVAMSSPASMMRWRCCQDQCFTVDGFTGMLSTLVRHSLPTPYRLNCRTAS